MSEFPDPNLKQLEENDMPFCFVPFWHQLNWEKLGFKRNHTVTTTEVGEHGYVCMYIPSPISAPQR